MTGHSTGTPLAETRVERRGAALWLWMNRPASDNRLTPTMINEINRSLDHAEKDNAIRAFVLSAEPAVFCLGCDHYELRTLGSSDDTALRLVEQVRVLCERLERFPKPVIAAVNGNAKGGGFELLLVCDIIIAVNTARIGDAHAGFTMPGAGSVTRSYHRLGASLARYVQLSGEMLPADALVASGFVTKVVGAERLMDEVDAAVVAISSKTPAASRRLKEALLNAALHPRDVALEREYALFDQQTHEPEVAAGMLQLNALLKKLNK